MKVKINGKEKEMSPEEFWALSDDERKDALVKVDGEWVRAARFVDSGDDVDIT